jgi:hypothetical protein
LRIQSKERKPEIISEDLLKGNEAICRKWFPKQLFNNSREQQLCSESRDLCNFGANLVSRHLISRLPNECLDCDSNEAFGSRKIVSRVMEAEIVFVIGCDLETRDLKPKLIRLSKALRQEFSSTGIEAKFQVLLKSEKNYLKFWPNFESKLNLEKVSLNFCQFNDSFDERNNSSKCLLSSYCSNSLDFLLVTSYPTSIASKHFILITNSKTDCILNDIDFITARSLLL